MNLRCANAAIKEIVQLAVDPLNAPEPVVAALDWWNIYLKLNCFIWILLYIHIHMHAIKRNFYEKKFFLA